MPGPGRMRGPAPKVKNPGKLLARLLGYVTRKYLIQCIIVVICIFAGVLANVQGTMFMRDLIDSYITPLIGQENPDFGPLLAAILPEAGFLAIVIISTFTYNRIMV